jgi:plasmid stabilization system protein ParE
MAASSVRRLIVTHSLPADTRTRFKRSVAPLADFPRLGRLLEGRGYDGLRFVLGPWRWMIVVYDYQLEADVVQILLVEDGRSSKAATNYLA